MKLGYEVIKEILIFSVPKSQNSTEALKDKKKFHCARWRYDFLVKNPGISSVSV